MAVNPGELLVGFIGLQATWEWLSVAVLNYLAYLFVPHSIISSAPFKQNGY